MIEEINDSSFISLHSCNIRMNAVATNNHGRRLRENWVDGPPKFEVGETAKASVPQYFEK